MNSELLLYWMSHRVEGPWAGFKKAVGELTPDSSDRAALVRRIKTALSDIGHADFFIDDTYRWRVRPPMIAGLGGSESAAVLCGSRTPELILSLQAAAAETQCHVSIVESAEGLRRIELSGELGMIAQVAKMIDIPFVPEAPARLMEGIVPIPLQMEKAPGEEQPSNWDAEYFDVRQMRWLKGIQTNSACRFTPHNGPSKFLLHRRHRKFLRLSKREAVYASAMLQSADLLLYEPSTALLIVPVTAPLPESLARIACLCTGSQPQFEAGSLIYKSVPCDIAAAILVAVGQPHPSMQPIARMTRRRIVG
jgi:hypothetical protein